MRNTLNIRCTLFKKTHLPKLHLTHKSLNMVRLGYEYHYDTPNNAVPRLLQKQTYLAKTNSFTIS